MRRRLALSKWIVVVKDEVKTDSAGKTYKKKKRRLILNMKQPRVIVASVKTERPELPIILDAIFAGLKLLKANRGRKLRHSVLDFRNAFF